MKLLLVLLVSAVAAQEPVYQGAPMDQKNVYQGAPMDQKNVYQAAPMDQKAVYQGAPMAREAAYQGAPTAEEPVFGPWDQPSVDRQDFAARQGQVQQVGEWYPVEEDYSPPGRAANPWEVALTTGFSLDLKKVALVAIPVAALAVGAYFLVVKFDLVKRMREHPKIEKILDKVSDKVDEMTKEARSLELIPLAQQVFDAIDKYRDSSE